MEVLDNILFVVGEYSYLILIITTLTLLYNKPTLYYYYIFGVIINSILNINLKLLIREPRPPHILPSKKQIIIPQMIIPLIIPAEAATSANLHLLPILIFTECHPVTRNLLFFQQCIFC